MINSRVSKLLRRIPILNYFISVNTGEKHKDGVFFKVTGNRHNQTRHQGTQERNRRIKQLESGHRRLKHHNPYVF